MKQQEHIHYWTESKEIENGIVDWVWICFGCGAKTYTDRNPDLIPSAWNLTKHAEKEAKSFEKI